MSESTWWRLECLCDEDFAEMGTELLWEAGAQGVEIQDRTTYMEDTDSPGAVPVNMMAPVPDGRSRLIAFFEFNDESPQTFQSPSENLEVISFDRYDDRSWETRWKDWFKAVQISPRLSVGPPWEESPNPNTVHILIEPGMAFGTGTHDTTKLCAQAIDETLGAWSEAPDVLDVGCGSAILAIMAKKLGASRVIGIDNDPVAVEVAQDNLVLNHTPDIELSTKTLNELGEFELVIANILAPVLVELKDELIARVKVGGTLVMSGITTQQRDAHEATFNHAPLAHIDTKVSGDWIATTWKKL